jgi:hypothetical protein
MKRPCAATYAALADLIRLIADPDGCAKRMRALQKLEAETAKAQATSKRSAPRMSGRLPSSPSARWPCASARLRYQLPSER